MTALCRCGQVGRRHEITDACLSLADLELVRRFAAYYDMAELGPWWHQSAGLEPAANATAQGVHNPVAHAPTSPQRGDSHACNDKT